MTRTARTRVSTALTLAVLGGAAATAVAVSGASADEGARPSKGHHAPAPRGDQAPTVASEPSGASTSAPYLPGVPHVPVDVRLVLGPGGAEEGSRFVNPDGSTWTEPGR